MRIRSGRCFESLSGTRGERQSLSSTYSTLIGQGVLAFLLATCLGACSLLDDYVLNNTDLSQMEGAAQESLMPQKSAGHLAEIIDIFPICKSEGAPGNSAVSVDKDGHVVLWTIASGSAHELYHYEVRSGSAVDHVAFYAPGFLLALSEHEHITVVSLRDGKQLARFHSGGSAFSALQFEAGGGAILAGAYGGRIYRWKLGVEAGEAVTKPEVYFGHAGAVSAVAPHPFGRVFFSADLQGSLNAWLVYEADRFDGAYDENLFGGKFFATESVRVTKGRGGDFGIDHLRVTSDGQLLLSGLQNGQVELWKVRGLARDKVLDAHDGLIYDLVVSPEGHDFASLGRDGLLKIWRINENLAADGLYTHFNASPLKSLPLAEARRLAFCSAGTLLAGGVTGRVFEIKYQEDANAGS
jgi:WD40 repeat protein